MPEKKGALSENYFEEDFGFIFVCIDISCLDK
jgi:hypothetical protein